METEAERLASFIKGTIKLSNKDLADILGVSLANLSRYASLKPENARPIPRDILCKLRELYRLDLNWLITGGSDAIHPVLPLCIWKSNSPEPTEKLQKQGEITVPLSLLGNYRPQWLKAIRVEGIEYTVYGKGIEIGDIVIFLPVDDEEAKKEGRKDNYVIGKSDPMSSIERFLQRV